MMASAANRSHSTVCERINTDEKKRDKHTDWNKHTWFVWFLVCYSCDFVTSIHHISFIYEYTHRAHRHSHIQPHTWTGFSLDMEFFVAVCDCSLFPFSLFSSKEMSHHSTEHTDPSIIKYEGKKINVQWTRNSAGEIEPKKKEKTGKELKTEVITHPNTQTVCEWWHWKKWHFLCKIFRANTYWLTHTFGGSNILLWLAFVHLKDENMASSIQNC